MAMEGLDWIANSEITSNKASSSGFANSACLIASASSAKWAAVMPLARRSIACSRSFSLRETWAKAGLPRRLLRRLREAPAWARNSAAIAKQTGTRRRAATEREQLRMFIGYGTTFALVHER